MKRPAFQFYPKDWRSDVQLRSCSVAARGLWVDLMCLMHDGKPYGTLTLHGKIMPDLTAAQLIGLPLTTYRKLLKELETIGVSSRTETGILFSRRMMKDEHIRQIRAAAGGAGGAVFALAKVQQIVSKSPANSQQTVQPPGQQKHEQTVAAAEEDVVGSTQGGTGGGKSDTVRNLLPEDCREAFDGLLRASPNPAAFVGEIRMAPERIRGATWAHVGAALRDLALAGNARPSGLAFRSFVQKAIEEAAGRPGRKIETGLDFEAAAREAERAR
jgi:hypothetical protein